MTPFPEEEVAAVARGLTKEQRRWLRVERPNPIRINSINAMATATTLEHRRILQWTGNEGWPVLYRRTPLGHAVAAYLREAGSNG